MIVHMIMTSLLLAPTVVYNLLCHWYLDFCITHLSHQPDNRKTRYSNIGRAGCPAMSFVFVCWHTTNKYQKYKSVELGDQLSNVLLLQVALNVSMSSRNIAAFIHYQRALMLSCISQEHCCLHKLLHFFGLPPAFCICLLGELFEVALILQ